MHPFRIVEDESFLMLVKSNGSELDLPSRQALKAAVIAKAEFARGLLKSKLRETQYNVCLSMDLWTNKKMESFMGITGHFVLDGAVRDATLHFGRFDTEATADNLAKELRQIIASYGLDERIASFTVDNGQNVLNAVKLLGIEPTRCAAHVLNIAVKDGLAAISNGLVGKVRSLCTAVRGRKACKARFLLLQGARPRNLIMDVSTRWNSTFDMLDRLIHLKDYVKRLLSTTTSLASVKLTREEWDEIEELRDFLKPFKTATEYFCTSRYPTTSVMYIFWKALLDHIQVYRYGGLRRSATAIRATLTTYWSYNDLDVMIAYRLDPRFKDVAIPDRNRKELHTEIYNRLRNRDSLPQVANVAHLAGQVIRDLAPSNPFDVFKLEISSFFASEVVPIRLS